MRKTTPTIIAGDDKAPPETLIVKDRKRFENVSLIIYIYFWNIPEDEFIQAKATYNSLSFHNHYNSKPLIVQSEFPFVLDVCL